MPENKNVPGARPAGPARSAKSWQEQLAAIRASGLASASKARAGDMSGAAANAMEAGKSIVARARILLGKGFSNGTLREKVIVAATAALVLLVVGYWMGIPQWMKQRKENRQWTVVNNLTPERLLKRCGKPISDETRDVYPVIARDIRYEAEPSGTVVLKFSRTAEESSDWVFISMQDTASGSTYETPIAKITALSCLDSSK